MTASVVRRRFLTIAAAAGAAALAAAAAGIRITGGAPVVWRGRALGSEASLTILADDQDQARAAIARITAEVDRLEAIFSLYLPQSELARLNRDGAVDDASLDLRRVIAASQRFGMITRGAFDITVQPLWELYARHFSAAGADPDGPPAEAIDAARATVDYRALSLDGTAVGFQRPGMAATLNGIAQGYVTDRVAALLVEAGFPHALIDMGELAAPAAPPGEAGWRVGIADPRSRGRVIDRVILGPHQAMATSSGLATRFDADGRYHHIFEPATGRSAQGVEAVTVFAGSAMVADALSTALAVRGIADAATLLRAGGASAAIVIGKDGGVRRIVA